MNVRWTSMAAVAASAMLLASCASGTGSEAQIDALEAEVARLESQIEGLTEELAAQEAQAADTSASSTSTTATPATSSTTSSSTTTTAATTTTESSGDPRPPQASPFVGGTFEGELPAGSPNAVEVIATGSDLSQYLPVIVRNNTKDPITAIDISAIARDADGALYSTGGSQGLSPNLVAPGEIAFGYVYFGFDVDLDAAASVDFSISWESDSRSILNTVDAEPIEWSRTGDNIAVLLTNTDTSTTIEGPIGIATACFTEAGAFETVHTGFADGDQIPPEGVAAGQIWIGRTECDQYLVSGSGYDF